MPIERGRRERKEMKDGGSGATWRRNVPAASLMTVLRSAIVAFTLGVRGFSLACMACAAATRSSGVYVRRGATRSIVLLMRIFDCMPAKRKKKRISTDSKHYRNQLDSLERKQKIYSILSPLILGSSVGSSDAPIVFFFNEKKNTDIKRQSKLILKY